MLRHIPCRTGIVDALDIVKQSMLVFAAMTVAACSPPAHLASGNKNGATPHEAGTARATGDRAGAELAILAWARDRYGPRLHEPVQMFHGDFTGDGIDDALAWVLYASGGNSDFLDVALFRNEDGRLVYHRSAVDVFGGEPRNIVFVPGRITLTSTMPRPDDPRCCPTGSQDWTIDTN